MHQYLHAKLKVLIKNATENTAMINKEVNRFLPKWVKEKIEIIDRGQDIQAKVMFRIISTCYINSINFGYKSFYSTFTLLLIV